MPRRGLLLVVWGVAVGAALGCVDQPLIAIERQPGAGGTDSHDNNVGGRDADEREAGGKGSNDPSGGWRGTGGSGQVGGAGGSNDQTIGCISKVGVGCDLDDACCMGMQCENGTCCKTDGQYCRTDGECCGGSCSNSTCVNSVVKWVTPKCLVVASSQTCTTSSDCCTGRCAYGVDGTKRCQLTEGCMPIGEYGQFDWDCCSGKKDLTGQCSAHNPYCKLPGDTCGSDAWDQRTACCPGFICQEGPEQVERCQRQADFVPAGDGCNVASDCALIDGKEARCLRNTRGPINSVYGKFYGICQVCGLAGQSCQTDFDCCKPAETDTGAELKCRDNRCTETITQNTTSCGRSGDDCEIASSSSGGSSTAELTCCSGLECDSKTSECVQTQ